MNKRKHVNKHASARQFKREARSIAAANMVTPMRGGWRL